MGALLKHPIISGIVVSLTCAAVIAAVSFYIPSFAPIAAGITKAFHFLIVDVTLPRWFFWFWLVGSIGSLIALIVTIYVRKVSTGHSEKSYSSDVMFGLRWRWALSINGIGHPAAFCPKCDNQLTINDFEPQIHGGACFRCDVCGEEGRIDTHMLPDTAARAAREAERRYRTGEWRGADERIASARRRI